ncbi:thiamine pyrophosphate-dependent enzyme [Halorussus salinisoli]|uniref:thiamine pyrophosphate-dependent enzyme n=1 Tax=Halorussus salinisoli TaxID=2558242 RepID=UPI0010C20DD9|nr:thiamine pyrophosphate-dependent enzyme [Halorussus salinisoli]
MTDRSNTKQLADQVIATETILDVTPDAVLVSNLGVASYVLAGVEDRDRNFYMWGSMGVTTPVGFGLALSTDDQVTVLEGDGSLLMSLGALSTVGAHGPDNLVIVVWNNRKYVTTGGQPTHAETTDFVGAAESCGVRATQVSSDGDFENAYREAVAHDGPMLVVCDVEEIDPDTRPPYDFAHIKRRVRESLTESST